MKDGGRTEAIETMPRARQGRKELSAGKLALLMNCPSLLLMSVVLIFPLCYAAYLSFSKVRIALSSWISGQAQERQLYSSLSLLRES